MIAPKTITTAGLRALAGELLAAGTRVIAPHRVPAAPHKTAYRVLERAEDLVLDAASPPALSLKAQFLPPTEVLLRWRQRKADVAVEEVPTQFAPQVMLGARPCDAAGIETLDRVMGWDYRDELWFGRREATTIVALACSAGGDASCFCSAVGLGPDSGRGADVLLRPAAAGGNGDAFVAEILTAKGEALVAAHASCFGAADVDESAVAAASAAMAPAREKVAKNLPLRAASLAEWLGNHFEHPFFDDVALRCHGCGACASVCPTCHCFDIVDEPAGIDRGARRRNWDTCQTAKFTVHASGHNPRATQHARFRQRLNHKFSIYPRRFGEVLCTGCGRCVRACPGGMDLTEALGRLAQLAQADGVDTAATTTTTPPGGRP